MRKKAIMKVTVIIFIILTITLLCSTSCDRSFDEPSIIAFSEPTIVDLPAGTTNSESRKFIDVNADGIEDMIQLNGFLGSDYLAEFFPGSYVDGVLSFQDRDSWSASLPFEKNWWSDNIKIDAADPNGDGYGDLIITEYRDAVFGTKDRFTVKAAMNDKDRGFRFVKTRMHDGKSLDKHIERMIISTYIDDEDGSLYDYMALDWADADGDGKDDLWMFWDLGMSLDVTIFPTEEASLDVITFKSPLRAKVSGFMVRRSIQQLDTGDANGDGKADLWIYHKPLFRRNKVSISLAFGDGNGNFKPQPDITEDDVHMSGLAFSLRRGKFEKRDSFDANGDGKADYAHTGMKKGKRIVAYKFAQ